MSAANTADILKIIEVTIRTRFIYLLYRLALALAIPPLILYFAHRVFRDRRYLRGFAERFGFVRPQNHRTPAGAIWLHAVSVGEVMSAVPLIRALRARYAAAPVYVSCATLAGRQIAQEKLSALVDGLFYAPLDYPWCVRGVLRRIRPSLVVVMETEIWPNLFRETKRTGAGLVVVNGRISDRAFPKYRPWAWFFGAVLRHADLLLVQSEEDRRRYIALGAPGDRVRVGGNLKYDFNPGEGEIPGVIRDLFASRAPCRIVIAASTMPPRDSADVDEDDIVIPAFQRLAAAHPDVLFVLVPRRPERFDVAASKLDAAGVAYVRRTGLPDAPVPPLPCVMLLDSMGELGRLFAAADVVFMGGTFPRRGGHNILEPAYFGKAVIAGPHMENFAAIAEEFTKAGALVRVAEPAGLAGAISALLDDEAARQRIGSRARELALSKRGVTDRLAGELIGIYRERLPLRPRSVLLAPFAALWNFETERRRAGTNRGTLARPVVSIGNITMGGAGKTPMVDWLAARLNERGANPAILTRGYRRKSDAGCVIIPAGGSAAPELTGDEPQVFLRRGMAHVGVGSNRFECGRRLIEMLDPGIVLLDDGFQHWRLNRDFDLVLIDALDPFGGGAVFPRGRMREPLDGLSRASAFVITRVEPGMDTAPIEGVIRRHNRDAPVFRARVIPAGWIEVGTGRTVATAPARAICAFCGLGNPRGFWRTLEAMGIEIRYRWAFGDHQHYRIPQLRRLGEAARELGAEAVVTTEKDIPNLTPNAAQLMAPLPLYALRIEMEVEDGDRLLEMLAHLR